MVGLPEGDRGYTHNFKRVAEEWTLETVNYHRYMPYAVIVGMLFLPAECMTDRKNRTSLSTALEHFGSYRGRPDHRADSDEMEEIYVGIYEPDGPNKGRVFFVSAELDLAPRAVPPAGIRLSFEDVKDALVHRFKHRNPKLKVQGMP